MEPFNRIGESAREQHELARVIAALLESNIEDTALAITVGADPTSVDEEIAGHVLDWLEARGWKAPHTKA